MMKKLRLVLTIAVLSLVAAGLYPSNLSATNSWTAPNQFLAAGSSAQFNSVGLAALDPNAAGLGNTPCTAGSSTSHWTNSGSLGKSGVQIHDTRSISINDEIGPVWIGWDSYFIQGIDYVNGWNSVTTPPAAGTGTICVYVSLDSVVGMRSYFASAEMLLESASGTADTTGVIPGLPAGSALPQEVVYFFNNPIPVVNVGVTDIRPEDGKFATVRAQCTPTGAKMTGQSYQCLGYGSPIGTPIKSNYPSSTKVMQVVDFVIDQTPPADVDPISGATPRTYSVATLGAAPVMILANITNTGSGHLGNSSYTQINHQVLANIFSGLNHEIRDIGNNGSSDPSYPLQVFQREALSGTYNTFDWNVTCAPSLYFGYSGGTYRCQETGVNPTVCATPGTAPCGNPMYYTYSTAGGTASRQRVIGTGEMIKAVCGYTSGSGGFGGTGEADSIGYAFWGFANFNGLQANCKYLPVDDIDPLYAYPAQNPGGVGYFPQCTWSSPVVCPTLPFTKIYDGAYPIWTIYRWVYYPGTYYNNILLYAQYAASKTTGLQDFVPSVNGITSATLNVFRSHYAQIVRDSGQGQYGSNGILTLQGQESEVGGDMGGEVLTVTSEIDYSNDQTTSGACTNWPNISQPGQCEQTNLPQL